MQNLVPNGAVCGIHPEGFSVQFSPAHNYLEKIMSLWFVRAGKYGEHEQRFFTTNSIYLTWERLEHTNLGVAKSFEDVKSIMRSAYPEFGERQLGNNSGQVWAFAVAMKPGDLIAVPRKTTPAIAFGKITGEYHHDPNADGLYQHSRAVHWLNLELPRSTIDQELLYSFGSLLTICEIKKNNAEERVRKILSMPVQVASPQNASDHSESSSGTPVHPEQERLDLEQLARDQIAKQIIAKFKGHGLARLVEAILQAQGYTTFLSPEGPDGGVDILASAGPLGFGQPRICVQVKSSDSPVDTPTLNQLVGTMQNVHADQGLLVSWGGFKASVLRELPRQFFRVRLWDQKELISELFAHYERLDEDIRTELPLKRIWTMAVEEEL